MRILIAEDDLTSRCRLAAVLRQSGHEVIEYEDGVSAWEALRQPDAPQMAVLDWMMPGMDGLEVLRRVRAVPTDRPKYVLLLTSRDEKTDIIAGLEAGANDYLGKPFHVGELRARIEVGCRMIEMQEQLAAKAEELRSAFEQIKTLRGILPICAHCKKIRDDSGYWQQVEVYVRDHTEAAFSHGICPSCIEKLYPEFRDQDDPTPNTPQP